VSALVCWQVLLFAIGGRQAYMRSIAADKATDFSHPAAHARVDILVHHLNFLAEQFAPEWVSPCLPLLQAHYESLWAEDLAQLVNDGIEYARYTFDEEGPHKNVGRVRSFIKGGQIRFVPSTFSKLERFFLAPLLLEAEHVGWDAAIQSRVQEHMQYLETFRLNDRPIILQLGRRLHDVNIRLISEARP
jgi:hypothetical protein